MFIYRLPPFIASHKTLKMFSIFVTEDKKKMYVPFQFLRFLYVGMVNFDAQNDVLSHNIVLTSSDIIVYQHKTAFTFRNHMYPRRFRDFHMNASPIRNNAEKTKITVEIF